MSDTTGFDVNEKVNVLFKTAMGFPSTKESTNWFQETNVPYNTYVFGSDILTDDIPTNPTYGAAKTSASVGLTDNDFDSGGFVKDSTDGKVRYYHRLILDPCITNNNDSWHKENSSGVNVLMNALQFNVNKTASNTPYGYVLTNKANVAADNAAPNEILQNAAGGNWFFDIKSGIVFFPDNSTPSLGVVDNSTKKPVFSFYKYIGNKGLSTWSGGGGGGGSTTLGGLTDVSTTGASSGQAIVYNGSSWAPGSVASGGGGSGQSSDGVLDGQVLEKLIGNCDGRSVTVSSGTYTIQDARGSSTYSGTQWGGQTTNTTWTTIKGSEISYKPPSGTNKVLFKFNFNVRYLDEDCIIYTRLIIDGSDRIFFKEISTREYPSLQVQLAYVIDIGEVDEINDHSAKFLNWDSLKTLKLEVRSHSSSQDAILFVSQWDQENSDYDVFQFPILEITAIGRGKSGVALAGTNLVHKRITNSFSYSNIAQVVTPANTVASATELTEFEIKINPEYSDSVIHAEWNIWHEGNENMVFRIVRFVNGVSTVFSNDDTTAESGYAVVKYDTNIDSTPNQLIMDLYDEPNTTSEVTYKIYISNIYALTYHIVFNRAYNDDGFAASAPSPTGEKLVSTVKAIEYPKPNKALNPITSATQVDGQVLETLAGKADGSSITVSSGTYTMPTALADGTYVSHTYMKETASEITYKAPAGTERILFEFIGVYYYGDADATLEGEFYVDDVKYPGSGSRGHFKLRQGRSPNGEIPFPQVIITSSQYDLSVAHKYYWKMKSYSTGHQLYTGYVSAADAGLYPTAGEQFLKIQAIGRADYDVVQRVVTYKDGQVLETLVGICDGRSITVSSGTYTLPNVTALQDLTETMVDLTGSTISYKPPVGTKTVIYKWKYRTNINDGAFFNMGYQLYIDNVAFGDVELRGNQEYQDSYDELEVIINITGTDDYDNHSISSWNSLKTLKLKGRERSSIRQSEIHATGGYTTEVGGDASPAVRPPRMKIIAIGRQVAPASAADFKIQKVDTISTLPNNGNMLTWDQAKGRWKPSEFIVENNDGTKNISDTNLYHGYTVSGSSTLNSSPQEAPHQAFRLTEPYNSESTTGQWNSIQNVYNTSTGAYTGSQTTSGYGGEWIQINFGKKANVYHYHITPEYTANTPRWKRAPKEYKVFGSNDGTTWVEVHSGSATSTDYTGTESPGTSDYASGLVKTNTLSTPATYQYFRLVINKNFGGDNYCGLMYLAFYGNFPNERIQTLPVSGTNMINTTYTTQTTLSVPDSVPGVNISALNLTITPEYSDSVIELTFNLFNEVNNDCLYRITRNINGTDVLVIPATNIWEGAINVPKYDNNTSSTPEVTCVRWYDEPNTTKPVTYKLWINSTQTGGTQPLYLNRSQGSTGQSLYEGGVSTSAAIEHPKPNTAVLSSVNNSTAVEGQVLETLSGMCDGRSISVASGNYTLQDVTSTILVTGSNSTAGQPNDPWIDLTGSTINYTPPVGTKQVIYEFDYAHSSTDTNYVGAMHNHRILLDGVKIEQSQRSHRTGGASMYEVAHERVMCIIDIVEEDDITNNKVKSWRTSKEIKIQVASYSSNYKALMHSIQHGRGQYYGLAPENGGTHDDDVGHLRKPNIKITAVGTAQYDVVQRVATYKDGQLLEKLAGELDGRTVAVSSGTYTLGNVTERYDPVSPSSGFTAIPNCSIYYKPPGGTKVLNYKIRIFAQQKDNMDCFIKFMLYVDNSPITASYEIFGTPSNIHQMQYITYSYQIQIGETDDIPNGKFSNWNSNKLIEIRAMDGGPSSGATSTNFEMYLHSSWIPGPEPGDAVATDAVESLHRPKLEITAIGRAVEPASAADFKIQRVNTLSSEPDNGSVLLYDSGKKEWTASGTRMEDQDIRLLSDPAVHVGHEHSASSIFNDSDEYYEPHHAFNYTQSQYYNSIWGSATSNYNTTSGAYTGSTSTEGYNGEWIQINLKRKAKIYYYGVMAEKRRDVKRCPKSWRLYGSNNGTNWTQLDEQEDRLFDNWWSKNQSSEWPSGTTSQNTSVMWGMNLQKIELSQPATYQYFRMVINESNGTDTKVNLNFLGFYGVWNTISATTSVLAGVNLSYVNFKDAESVTIGNTSHTEIQGLRLSFTPEHNDSVVELNYVVMLENAGSYNTTRDIGAVLTRTVNGVETIFRSNGGTDRWDTLQATSGYDGYSHHMHMMSIKYYDEPNTTMPITYKIKLIQTGAGTNQLVYINRTATDAGSATSETSISVASAKELPKPQAILSNVSNSTALEGQVLENLAGICDGKSVTVSSGTYTLENVNAILDLTTSYQDITGSKISYKPPIGTKKVKYAFRWYWRFGPESTPHDNQSIFQIKLFLGGSEVTSFFGTRAHGYYEMMHHEEEFIFEIGEIDDLANGKLLTWDTLKEIKLQAKEAFGGNYETTFHIQWPQGDAGAIVHKPNMEITAIGTTYHSAVPRIVTKKSGQLLETIAGMCDGRSITSASGTYTLESVTQGTLISSSSSNFIDFPGSSINYKPPSGAKQVFYTFHFATGRYDAGSSLGFKFFIDGAEATIFKKYYGTNGDYGSSLHTIHFVIDIGSVASDDITNGKLATWNTLKTIKVQVCAENTDYETWINKHYYDMQQGQSDSNADTSHSASTYVRKPLLKIQAFGEAGTFGHSMAEVGGKIGIGTDNPLATLDFGDSGGDIRIARDAGNQNNQKIGRSDPNGNWYCYMNFIDENPSANNWNNDGISFHVHEHLVGLREIMRLSGNGNVGIGTTSPTAPLHIAGHVSNDLSGYGYWWSGGSSTGTGSGGGNHHLGLIVEKRAWIKDNILVSSDRRIKENIEDVPDDLALQQVRNLPTRYYEYKDKINKGEGKTIGFIAQEVKEVLPMAVTEQTSILPNENRGLNNIEWSEHEDKYKLTTDLQNVSGVKYRFYVTNDLSDNEVMKEIVGNADDTFTFEEKWEYVFCYGKEVDDFHVLDKQKLFALNFSATQELDRQQQADKAEIAELKTKNTELENRVKELENIIKETENKVNDAEMKVNTVYHKNGLLEAEIMMIKNKLGM